jgi:pimeloyl-ACP methyl ester carboxylesterase
MTALHGSLIETTATSADGTEIAYKTLGEGRGLIVVGGALRTGDDYLRLAEELAGTFAVHVIDRRGRGASGPQGPDYSVAKECEDLLAVQAATGATAVFGHSYGGFVALEAARTTSKFSHIAVYEPGVSLAGSIPMAWLPRYRQLLASGDKRGALAVFVRGIGSAPGPVARLPLWYLRAVLHVMIRGERWRRMEPLLEANAAEHEQEARRDDGTAERYRSIRARLLLLGGSKSPPVLTTQLFSALEQVTSDATVEILDGLDHFAPDEKAPAPVANRVHNFLS